MWHGGDGRSGVEALRHECSEGDGLGPYGWVEHDGRSYGKQDIEDKRAGIRLVTSMVKPAQLHQHGGSLAVDEDAADGELGRWLSWRRCPPAILTCLAEPRVKSLIASLRRSHASGRAMPSNAACRRARDTNVARE